MFKNETDFNKIVGRLNIDDKPNPAHRESLRRQMLSAFNKTGEQSLSQSGPLWRTIMKSPITKLAAAAGIIIAVLIGIHQFGGSIDGATVALAQVKENMKKMPWIHIMMEGLHSGAEVTEELWLSFESKILASKQADGRSEYLDYEKHQKYEYDPCSQTITVSQLQDDWPSPEILRSRFFLDKIIETHTEEGAEITCRAGKYKDKTVDIYDIVFAKWTIGVIMQLFVDSESHLIIAASEIHGDSGGTILDIDSEFQYPQKGPRSIYDLGVSESAIVKTRDVSKQYAADAGIPKLVPLAIKLPRPMFVGTPQDVKVPRLEKPLGRPRPPFYAPIGTKNAAFGKPVTSTDEDPIIGKLEWITDGDKEGADGSFVELGPFEQHVTIDLEAEHNIYAIVVWHYHKEAHVYFDVVVQAADDPDFTANVTTVFNNDIDNSLGLGVGKNMHYTETAEGKLIDAKGARARYVRLHSNGNTTYDTNHYIEVEVYGKAAK